MLVVLTALKEGVQRAARFAVEGDSLKTGPKPGWLDAISQIDVTGLRAGSAVIAIETPTFRDAEPERFQDPIQLSSFGELPRTLDVSLSAIDVFGDILAKAVNDDVESLNADRSLIEACIGFARVSTKVFKGVQLGKVHGYSEPVTVDKKHVSKLQQLKAQTPASQAVRITGFLDTITASKSNIII